MDTGYWLLITVYWNRPVALRPHFSMGLPLSVEAQLILLYHLFAALSIACIVNLA